MNTLEAKKEALAKERIETKYKSHKDCTFIEVVTADKLQEFHNFISKHYAIRKRITKDTMIDIV